MKLDEQVASLSLSKRLKEKGYPQEGLWWWEEYPKRVDREGEEKILISNSRYKIKSDMFKYFVAPTVAELGERLPLNFMAFKSRKGTWDCYESGKPNRLEFFNYFGESAKTEVNARAKMWLYLKENNLLEREVDYAKDNSRN